MCVVVVVFLFCFVFVFFCWQKERTVQEDHERTKLKVGGDELSIGKDNFGMEAATIKQQSSKRS